MSSWLVDGMCNKGLEVDFFVVGSQRCGTTWIDKALRSTGKVLLPKNKQTYFYDRNYKLGLSWFERQFDPVDKDKHALIGEVATGYCLEGVIDLLAKDHPNAKIILAVREPVSRAYSNYIKRRDDYQDMSFEDAMNADNDLVERGLYGEMLERILKHYPLEKVKVLFFDDLEKDPKMFLEEIMSFLNLDCEIDDKLFTQNVNSSILAGVSKWAKKMHLFFIIRFIKMIGLTSIIRRLVYKLHKIKKQPLVLRSPRLYGFFDRSNKILEKICERDLGEWRRPWVEK